MKKDPNQITNERVQLVQSHLGPMLVFEEDWGVGYSLKVDGEFNESKIQEVVDFLAQKYNFKPHTFVDIGANIGTHLIYALKKAGFVDGIGLEPDRNNFRLLSCNIILNNLSEKSELLNVAVSNWEGSAELELSTHNFGDHRIRNSSKRQDISFGEDERSTYSVPVRSFDSIFVDKKVNWDRTLIWIDTQGHEGHIMSCFERMQFLSAKPFIVAEFWPYGLERSGGKELCFDFLKNCRKIYNISKPNWPIRGDVDINFLHNMYNLMLANTTADQHPHMDLLCIA